MKLVIQIVLWVAIVFLGWKVYSSITGPVEFNKIKEARYHKVIEKLKDIQKAELAYKEITGQFTGSFDSLIQFLDTAQFAITERRDTVYDDVERNKAFGIEKGYYVEESILDTLGFTPVRDSLFQGTDRYKKMMVVPLEGRETEFELRAGKIKRKDASYAVFEARMPKEVILEDLDKNLIVQEKQVQSVDGVNGEYLKVGSMEDVNTSGNWPKIYDSKND